jgi:hypothetical protein
MADFGPVVLEARTESGLGSSGMEVEEGPQALMGQEVREGQVPTQERTLSCQPRPWRIRGLAEVAVAREVM